MKKIFTLLTGTLLALSAYAVDEGEEMWTVTPTPDTSVESIDKIEITYSSADWKSITIDAESVEFYDGNDELFCGATIAYDNESEPRVITITPEKPIDTADYYALCIAARAVTFVDNNDAESYNSQMYYFTYEVTGNGGGTGGGGTTGEFSYTVTPADGEDVESISTIKFEFTGCAEAFIDGDMKSLITVTRDGQPYETKFKVENGYEEMYSTLTLLTPATEPGKYVITIPDNVLSYADENNDYISVPVTLKYTIGGGGSTGGFSYTVTPADGEEVQAPLSTIKFEFADCAEAFIDGDMKSLITVTRDGQPYETKFKVENGYEEMYSTLTLLTPATEPGKYVITIPDNVLSYADDYENYTSVPVTLTYTVTAAAAPVVYDLLPKSTKPTDGDVIDLSENPFNVLFLNVDADVNVASEGANVTIKNTDVEDGYNVTVPLLFSFSGRLWASFDEPTATGTYTITVPQGSFGDADWQKDHNTGRANPEIVITVSVKKNTSKSDLKPVSYTPDADTSDLSVITLTFDQEVQLTESARATLTDDGADYREAAEITVEGKVVTLKFNPAPAADGTYRLTVDSGSIADAEYISSEGFAGHTNSTITIDWTMSGIDAIMVAEDGCSYFNLQGQPVAAPVKGQILIRVKEGKATKIRF